MTSRKDARSAMSLRSFANRLGGRSRAVQRAAAAHRLRFLGPCLVLLVLVGACTAPSGGERAAIQAKQPGAAAEEDVSPRLQPGDEIEITLYEMPELDTRQTVRPDGTISLVMIRDPVKVAGLTVASLRSLLIELYRNNPEARVKNPDPTVLIRNLPSNRVFVGGEVVQQGPQTIQAAMTVSQAVILAQGLKTSADASKVLLVRQNGDRRAVRSVDLEKVLAGNADAADPVLQPLDVVYVPRSGIADAGLFVDRYIRQMLPISPGLGMSMP
ncbi:MAG: polysaccharide biosynthesis/export family protein [Alphaproteobacteria bacterium]|nr:polysaccharide biosynthesis/export family protein [Alphaproteobacteria bacterium]